MVLAVVLASSPLDPFSRAASLWMSSWKLRRKVKAKHQNWAVVKHEGVKAAAALLDGTIHMDDSVSAQQRATRTWLLGPASSHPRATAARRSRRAITAAATCRRIETGTRHRERISCAQAKRSGRGRCQLCGHDRQPAWEIRSGILRGDGCGLSSAEGKKNVCCMTTYCHITHVTKCHTGAQRYKYIYLWFVKHNNKTSKKHLLYSLWLLVCGLITVNSFVQYIMI